MNQPLHLAGLALVLTLGLNPPQLPAEQGTPIIELVNLEALARDKVYEFAFIGGALKLRGADAAPLRPIAIPVQRTKGGAS